jgi:hypothetical protein
MLASAIRVVLGGLLFVASLHRWLRRPKSVEEVNVPKWLVMIEVISPIKVFVVGFFFAVLTNPKNFALTVAGSLPMHIHCFPFQKTVLVAAFILYPAWDRIPAPLSSGRRFVKNIERLKAWLVANNSVVMNTML